MHPQRVMNEQSPENDDLEPQVLSYVQFRNHLVLLDWQRRRAEYERGEGRQPRATRAPGPGAPAG